MSSVFLYLDRVLYERSRPCSSASADFGNAHWHGNTGLVTDPENEGPWAGADLEQGMY